MSLLRIGWDNFIVTKGDANGPVVGKVMKVEGEWRAQPDDDTKPTSDRYDTADAAAEALLTEPRPPGYIGTVAASDVLAVTADRLQRGDVMIMGHMLRVLVAPLKRLQGYLEWEVSRDDVTGPVVGSHSFLDDGVATFVVLRKRT